MKKKSNITKRQLKEIAFVERILEKSYLQVVKVLKEAKIPCRVELTKDEILIVGGENLSEEFKDKVLYELSDTDVPYIEIKFSKTSSDKNILKFTEIAGGPEKEIVEEMVGVEMEYLASYPEDKNNIVKESKWTKEQVLNMEYLDSLSEEIREWFEEHEDELEKNNINTYEGYAPGARCANLPNVSSIVGKDAFGWIKHLGKEFDKTYPKVYSENGNFIEEGKVISRDKKPTEKEMELAFDTLRKNGVNTNVLTWSTLEDIYRAMEEYKTLSKKKSFTEDRKPWDWNISSEIAFEKLPKNLETYDFEDIYSKGNSPSDYFKDTPEEDKFLLRKGENLYYVDRSGYDYVRYIDKVKKPQLPEVGDIITVKGFGDVEVKDSYFDRTENMNAVKFEDSDGETLEAFYDSKYDYWIALID